MEVTIVIATFGDARWADLAATCALPSALALGAPVVMHHGGKSIAQARNAADELVETEWVCHLDADDELESSYIDAMSQAIADGRGDLFAPALRLVVDGKSGRAQVLDDRDMDRANPCAIGTVTRIDAIREAGGWWEEPAWEDWSLFRRMWLLGAKVTHVPEAVYRAHVDPAGRNSTVVDGARLSVRIRQSHRDWLDACELEVAQ